VFELNALALVHRLLQTKGVVIEVLLQHFIGKVDAELLEGVVVEDLEAENVQDTDLTRRFRVVPHGLVDAHHQPVEHCSVPMT